jgi:hypothetical protein
MHSPDLRLRDKIAIIDLTGRIAVAMFLVLVALCAVIREVPW